MIGIFDSGIGGLTVVKAFRELVAEYSLLYFGDTARMPYGTKSSETLLRYARQNTEWLLAHGAQMIVVACNSASAAATVQLRKAFPDVPFFGVVTPAVEAAIAATKNGRIGLVGTRATVASGMYESYAEKLSGGKAKVVSVACPLLVPLVEEGWLDSGETKRIIRKYVHPLRAKGVDTLVLGCTHYPLLKSLFQQKIGNGIALVDSAEAQAASVAHFLNNHPEWEKKLSKKKKDAFYVSDLTPQFQKTALRLLGESVTLHKVDFGK